MMDHLSVKDQQALKMMAYNRYLFLRYMLAISFFANLNWGIFLIISKSTIAILPILLIILSVGPIYEQLILYNKPFENKELKFSVGYFILQLIINVSLMSTVGIESLYQLLFPFMANNWYGRIGIIGIQMIGIIISFACINKIKKIKKNKDSGYKRLQQLNKTLQKEGQTYGK